MRVDWLPDVLGSAGLKVRTVGGWETRGNDSWVRRFNPQGIVWHHTATSPSLATTSLISLIIHGRSDLPGPLAQLVLERDGTFYVVASGKANHAGAGGWRGLNSNYQVLGIEPANDGRGEIWPQVQTDAYERGTKAILDKLGRTEDWVCGHREWAPTRKIDPYGLSMSVERKLVAAVGETVVIKPNAQGNYVRPYQQALNNWAVRQGVPNWTPLVVDGNYGPATTSAVTRYQNAADIIGIVPQTGALDDLTRDLLERFVEA